MWTIRMTRDEGIKVDEKSGLLKGDEEQKFLKVKHECARHCRIFSGS